MIVCLDYCLTESIFLITVSLRSAHFLLNYLLKLFIYRDSYFLSFYYDLMLLFDTNYRLLLLKLVIVLVFVIVLDKVVLLFYWIFLCFDLYLCLELICYFN